VPRCAGIVVVENVHKRLVGGPPLVSQPEGTQPALQLNALSQLTDEHDIGLFLKRGAMTETMLGDSAYHRDRCARLSGF
jgi:hypothetical protein